MEQTEKKQGRKTKQQGSYETAHTGQEEAEAIKATRSSEMKEAITNITEEETTTTQPENNHHVSGRPRQPKESGENAKGKVRYEADARTWQCAKCVKKYAEKVARGAASHVETHARTSQKIRRQQEQHIIPENAYRNSDKTRRARKARNIIKRHTGSIHGITRTEDATRTE